MNLATSPMLPLWIAATGLLVLVLGALLVPLLRDAGPRAEAPSGDDRFDPVETDRLRAVFLAKRQELELDLAHRALSAEDRDQAIAELEQRLAEDLRPAASPHRVEGRWWRHGPAAVLSVALPLAALALYLHVGDPRAAATAALGGTPGADPHPTEGVDVQAMVERLAARLQANPGDLQGWRMLARSREVQERYGDAAEAYRRAIALASTPEMVSLRAQLQADLADALGSMRNGDLDGPAQVAIDAALALDADQPKALALAGAAALRRGDTDAARRHWSRLLGLLEPGSDIAQRVASDLERLGPADPKRGAAAR